jgi:hypothetical protein
MRDVAVMDLARIDVPILAPLHQLSGAANFRRSNPVARCIQFRAELLIERQRPRPEAWVFPSERGTPLSRDNLLRRFIQPKLAGV